MEDTQRSRIYVIALALAVAVGVLLGNSAISAINPAHFRTVPVRVVDREAPNTGTIGSTPLYRTSLSPDEAMLMRESVCPGCYGQPDVQSASYSSMVPYFGSREERAAIEARERRAIDGAYVTREQRREAARPPTAIGGPYEEAPSGNRQLGADERMRPNSDQPSADQTGEAA